MEAIIKDMSGPQVLAESSYINNTSHMGVKKPHQFQPGTVALTDPAVPANNGATDLQATILLAGHGAHTGHHRGYEQG